MIVVGPNVWTTTWEKIAIAPESPLHTVAKSVKNDVQ